MGDSLADFRVPRQSEYRQKSTQGDNLNINQEGVLQEPQFDEIIPEAIAHHRAEDRVQGRGEHDRRVGRVGRLVRREGGYIVHDLFYNGLGGWLQGDLYQAA